MRPPRSHLSPFRRRSGSRRAATVVAIVVAAVALSGCFGQGIYSVSSPLTASSMPAGLWRSLGGSDCTWLRVDGASNAVVGRNVRTDGPQYMQLEPSDKGAAIGNCFPFWQQPGGFARPAVQPGSPFGDGDFLVGYEVNTGTYRATSSPGQICSWAAVKGFHGKNAAGANPDQLRGGATSSGAPVADIQPGDFGFTSQGCGQWNYIGPPPPPPGNGGGGGSGGGSGTTTTTRPPTPPDPIFHVSQEDFPDPHVLRVDNAARCGGDPAPCYYAYSTEAGFLGLLNVPVIRSSDLVNWKWAGPTAGGSTGAGRDAMPSLADWVTFGGNWAPAVIVNPSNANQYLMYYTAKSKAAATAGRECIGVATSSAPDGPYVDTRSAPLTCPGSGDVIDPSVFPDGAGGLWLQYTDPVGIQTQKLTTNFLGLTGSVTQLLSAVEDWENDRVEAPSMIQTADTGTLLFYSGNNFDVAGYAVGVARCTTPSSGCDRIASALPVLTNGFGPGGQSPFTLGDGTTWRLAYHQWTPVVGYNNGGLRTLHIAPMTFSGTSPNQSPVVG